MRRRNTLKLIGLTGVISLTGCLGASPETEGNDDNPIEAEPNELLPSADLFGDEWSQQDDEPTGLHPIELEGEAASTSFATPNGEEGIDLEVTVFDSVDQAMSGYQKMRDSDLRGDGSLVEDIDIGSEGHLMDLDLISVYFRDANVIGSIIHVTRGSSKSTQYGAAWHETWRE